MLKTVPVEEAVGQVIPHDITEIIKDVKKTTAFKKGHIIAESDIEHLKRLGKDHIYVLSLAKNEIHENEAATLLAAGLAGPNIVYSKNPEEGKIVLKAGCSGLLKVDRDRLYDFNVLGDVICSTLHDNTPVQQNEIVAATRLIPLVCDRQVVEKALSALSGTTPVINVVPLRKYRIGLVITGNEVFYNRIEDRFEEVLREKVKALGSELTVVRRAPDDKKIIAEEIHRCIDAGAELIVTSGGMSVDPDDVTREGIIGAGAVDVTYGTPVLPGAMLLCGFIGPVPVVGIPACGMYHKITVFDLILPRILIGEKIGRKQLAELGHGGLCRNCPTCRYPICNFGK
ncbi:molybdopterin-binding protein [Desulforhopalus singaporensis]|uniref:Molybdenum cofactor cytidylyltransferase n=1 Tax=Desulforhopalus singaporensis TaxID=91360 RepID=A0A1H0PKB4_9BACT|nr:molybdopterin-binding protein [Desulforhopalus singaporensis]SDP05059.1 molybdenum cofactor cytidylyltransferase [Desulforhopalus singaporensis]